MSEPIDTSRHDEVYRTDVWDLPITIIGVGGVGSQVARLLGKLQFGIANRISFYDGDVVEDHNIPNQAYDLEDVGQRKVAALRRHYQRWTGGHATPVIHPEMVRAPIELDGIVFMCLDRMEDRRRIMHQSVFNNSRVPLVIETRMDLSLARVFCFDPCDTFHQEVWESNWYPDEETENEGGCQGPQSAITSTTMPALIAVEQMRAFYDTGSAHTIANEIMISLRSWQTESYVWNDLRANLEA